jgi:hypothetical protein
MDHPAHPATDPTDTGQYRLDQVRHVVGDDLDQRRGAVGGAGRDGGRAGHPVGGECPGRPGRIQQGGLALGRAVRAEPIGWRVLGVAPGEFGQLSADRTRCGRAELAGLHRAGYTPARWATPCATQALPAQRFTVQRAGGQRFSVQGSFFTADMKFPTR